MNECIYPRVNEQIETKEDRQNERQKERQRERVSFGAMQPHEGAKLPLSQGKQRLERTTRLDVAVLIEI